MGEFRMPSLGAGMDTGTVVEWCVRPGDRVRRGDIVAVVETDKAAIEVEVFEDGVIEDLVVPEGVKVAVGTVLAHVGDGGARDEDRAETPAAPVPARVPGAEGPAHAPPAARRRERSVAGSAPAPAAPRRDEPGARRASPYARRLAAEQDLDLDNTSGSGPGGAVVVRDLGGPAAPVVTQDRDATMRQAIARAMALSKREIPHYYLSRSVDLEDTLQWLEARNEDRPPSERVLPAALVLRATAMACAQFPDLNGFWVDGAFRPADGIHVGVAISLRGGGLVAPAIHELDQRSLDECMAALADLVRRARAGGLRGSEVSDPTITVTNLGERGVDAVFGIITPPQVALVGAGRIAPRPWVRNDSVLVRRVVDLTLAADHRASDGHRGGLFLEFVARALQQPETL